MATLLEKRFNFNAQLWVDHIGGELTTDAGLVLVKELMAGFDFTVLAKKLVHFQEDRHYFQHSNVTLLEQTIFQLISGHQSASETK
ncbi:transposase [Loigolactobacillus rennini]|uniref:Transposase DDE domain-containing protein n=1 Tax=Loigolactobacillus rennini DSM 20253 TaxID=1423796 RepID=A0A0R2DDY5_9LACO|nr:transposase [Loigolactobacillus rennini]KRM98841.1 hypothetical protein FC24_GL000795 [Loigolactobacillus rennini DSM 20253]